VARFLERSAPPDVWADVLLVPPDDRRASGAGAAG